MTGEFEFSLDLNREMRREAFRSYIPGLKIRFASLDKSFEINNLSAKGAAFVAGQESFPINSTFFVDLGLMDKPFVNGLKARIVRFAEGGLVACAFEDMDRSQEIRLDKLLLEVQKRLIEIKKARKSAEKA